MKLKIAWGTKLPARRLPRLVLGGSQTRNCICQCDPSRQPTLIPNTNHNSTLSSLCIITELLLYIQELLLFTL
jgi:hypothetical protein